MAEATVRARYGRLVEDDVLQVIGVTNPLGLGFDAQALVGVNTAGAPEPVADVISSWPESSYVVVAAGRFDVLAELLCVDARHLLELTNRVRAIPDVVSTETFPYLQLAKQVYGWGTHLEAEQAPVTAMSADVRLDGVTKKFDEVTAVDNLSLEVESGKFYALLGPSGCGKTTTLRMIGGFEEPTVGDDLSRRQNRHRPAPAPARRQHRLPELRALPSPDDLRERRVRPPAQGKARRRAEDAGRRDAGHRRSRRVTAAVSRASCQAASSSGSRWRGRSSTIRASCCSTSRSAPSTSSSARRCSSSSRTSSARSGSRSCTSRTTRKRR